MHLLRHPRMHLLRHPHMHLLRHPRMLLSGDLLNSFTHSKGYLRVVRRLGRCRLGGRYDRNKSRHPHMHLLRHPHMHLLRHPRMLLSGDLLNSFTHSKGYLRVVRRLGRCRLGGRYDRNKSRHPHMHLLRHPHMHLLRHPRMLLSGDLLNSFAHSKGYSRVVR